VSTQKCQLIIEACLGRRLSNFLALASGLEDLKFDVLHQSIHSRGPLNAQQGRDEWRLRKKGLALAEASNHTAIGAQGAAPLSSPFSMALTVRLLARVLALH
jgi:hypothetical protein